jgi:glycosyltransferase involved in cell wall biosynthesis
VLGNYALNGQERGNIEVFRAVQGRGVDALFVTHADWGHAHLQPALDGLGLRWTTLPYARHFTKRMRPRDAARNLGRVMRGARVFRRIAEAYRPTHIHVANPHYFLCVLPALLRMRTPLIYRLGDVPTEHHVFYRVLWRRFVIPRVSTFVCVSEYVRDRLLETGCPPEKARVIYSHPPARSQGAELPDLRAFDGQTVAYVGQMAPHKGVDLLVKAAIEICRERDDVRFLLAGAVARSNAFALGLMGKVQAAGLSDRIRFLGYVEDVPALLAAADVHVCPSVCAEALANTVVEAKQAAVPSVVFASGGLPELVTDGVDGWVCAEKTAGGLGAALRVALGGEPGELAAMGSAAQSSMDRLEITEEAFAETWLDVYGVPVPTNPTVV